MHGENKDAMLLASMNDRQPVVLSTPTFARPFLISSGRAGMYINPSQAIYSDSAQHDQTSNRSRRTSKHLLCSLRLHRSLRFSTPLQRRRLSSPHPARRR